MALLLLPDPADGVAPRQEVAVEHALEQQAAHRLDDSLEGDDLGEVAHLVPEEREVALLAGHEDPLGGVIADPVENVVGVAEVPDLLGGHPGGHPLVGRGAEWEAVELGQALVDEDAP